MRREACRESWNWRVEDGSGGEKGLSPHAIIIKNFIVEGELYG